MFTWIPPAGHSLPPVTVTGEDNAVGADPLEPPLTAPLRRDLGWAHVQRMSQSAEYRDDPLLRRIRETAGGPPRHPDDQGPVARPRSPGIWPAGSRTASATAPATSRTSAAPTSWPCCAPTAPPTWRPVTRCAGAPSTRSTTRSPAARQQPGLAALPNAPAGRRARAGHRFHAEHRRADPGVRHRRLRRPADAGQRPAARRTPRTARRSCCTRTSRSRTAGCAWPGRSGGTCWTGIPGISPDQEYVPCTDAGSARLVGRAGGNQHEYEAVADPPGEFRVRALTRAARYPVSTLSRRAEQATWRGVPCWVLQRDDRWARLRLVRPDADALAATGARCYERGVYEAWAPELPTTHPDAPTPDRPRLTVGSIDPSDQSQSRRGRVVAGEAGQLLVDHGRVELAEHRLRRGQRRAGHQRHRLPRRADRCSRRSGSGTPGRRPGRRPPRSTASARARPVPPSSSCTFCAECGRNGVSSVLRR